MDGTNRRERAQRARALPLAVVALLALAVPGVAFAASAEVVGTVGSELSLSVSVPELRLSRTSTISSSLTVRAVGTLPGSTLTVNDPDPKTPGQMSRVDCDRRTSLPGTLPDSLGWSAEDGEESGFLSSTPAQIAARAVQTVELLQSVGPGETLASDACYQITLVWTLA